MSPRIEVRKGEPTASPVAMSPPTLSLSVIIPNYNYGRFIGAAIESALGLDWPSVEVIVVDDGSTDHSLAVIRSYPTIKLITQANAGQAVACDVGFAQSSGDLVIFLDSDDVLEPQAVRTCLREWRPGISKFQFQMLHIDECGTKFGTPFPMFDGTPSAADIRAFYFRSSAYPTPPGSGNIYTRGFVSSISPLEFGSDRAADSYYLAAAPVLGDVVTIAEPLALYRVHGANSSAMTALRPEVFGKDLIRAIERNSFAARVGARNGVAYPATNLFRSLKTLSLRACSLIYLGDAHPIPGDSRAAILRDCLAAVAVRQGNSIASQILQASWIVAVCLLPKSAGAALVLWRFVPSRRPIFLQSILRGLSRR